MNSYKALESENIIATYENLAMKYKQFENIIGIDHTDALIHFSKEFRRKVAANVEKDRNLRIGIVGQIKAGKSSFLNALLFEGKDLLPKAATPMTAALTKIAYAQKPKAVVEFYSEEEWDIIEKTAEKYDVIIEETKNRIKREKEARKKTVFGFNSLENNENRVENIHVTEEEVKLRAKIPAEMKSAKELCEMVEKKDLSVRGYLGKKEIIEGIDHLEDLIGKLNEYVGADGKFTPIVKSTKLYIDDENLKNMEIIDTPGVNDPILSRGMATKKFLAECDVVFLLSYAGQFMDHSDVEYLLEKLPNQGIRNIILLGSKFDSALLDEGDKYDQNIIRALKGISEKLKGQAENIVLPLIEQDPDNEILKNIKKSLPPQFISSMAYNMSRKFDHLNKEESHILHRLQKTFPSVTFDASLLNDLANIDNIKNKTFPHILKEKDQILQNKLENLVIGQKRAFKNQLMHIKKDCEVKLENISQGDKEKLNKQYKQIEKSITKAKGEVDLIFSRVIKKIEIDFTRLERELNAAANQYKKIAKKEGSYEEAYEVSTSKWWNPFSWGRTETRYRTVNYSYANVYEAVEKVSEFILKAEEDIQEELINIFDLKDLKNNLISAIIGVFDLSDENFNENEILGPVEKAIYKINIPDVRFDSNKYEQKILSKFNESTVKDEKVNALKRKQREVIGEILNDITKVIRAKALEMIHNLQKTSDDFIEKIIEDVKDTMEALKKQIDDKEKYENLYKKVLENIENDLVKVR